MRLAYERGGSAVCLCCRWKSAEPDPVLREAALLLHLRLVHGRDPRLICRTEEAEGKDGPRRAYTAPALMTVADFVREGPRHGR